MGCNTYALNGISLDCGNIGGINAIYIADTADVTGVTISGSTITSIGMASGKKFKVYAFRRGNASFTSTATKDVKAGTIYYQSDVNVTFNKQEATKRDELTNLMKKELYIIVKDNNGIYSYFGYDSVIGGYAEGSALVANSGAEMGEGNNLVLTLQAMTSELPYIVSSSAITSII